MRRGIVIVLILALAHPPEAGAQMATDIRGHWAEGRIVALLQRRIVDVFSDGSFRPGDPVRRDTLIRWVVAAKGLPLRRSLSPAFADVPAGHRAFAHVESAVAYGLIAPGRTLLPASLPTRAEAVMLVVRALGYTMEAAAMAQAPLPHADAAEVPSETRGAFAVAVLTQPPLLREPDGQTLRPRDPISRAEAASLIWAYLQAVERGVILRAGGPIAPGVTLIVEKRGALRTLPVWRVQVGAFQIRGSADRMAQAMRAQGLPTSVDFLDGLYKVRAGSFATAREAEAVAVKLAAQGLPTWVISTLGDFDQLAGPFRMATVIVDPRTGVRLVPMVARGQVVGRERVSEIARRYGAIAAVNGGFFSSDGDPLGCLMIAGELISEPNPNWTCAGITDDGQVVFDFLRLDGLVATENAHLSLSGVNRSRGENQLILYRPVYHTSTLTNPHGAEVVVVGDAVREVLDGQGNTPIPRDGYVLSGHGQARAWLLQHLKPGDKVTVTVRASPAVADPRWERVVHLIGGGPRLLAGGQFAGGEGFPAWFSDRRHPRTALGVFPDGRIILMVVDGRSPYHSLGMTLAELANEMRRLGVTDALNLDGGGSTTLAVNGRIVNVPSDETGERPVADALLVLPPRSQ